MVNLAMVSGRVVVVVYPFTGRPGFPNPPDWDNIPGAHGSTPQCLAFSAAYEEFAKRDVKLFGLSFQDKEWQQDFVARNNLAFPLLSDEHQEFAKSLGLDTFKAGEKDYLCRRALICRNGSVTHDVFPVAMPENNAADVLALLAP